MLETRQVYVIPGWGFSCDVFKMLISECLNIIPLNYFDMLELNFDLIAINLAQRVSNNAIVMGWSFGGMIGIKMAAMFPEKIKKLILISSQPRFLSAPNWRAIDPDVRDGFIDGLKYHYKKQVMKFISISGYPDSNLSSKEFLNNCFIHSNNEYLLQLLRMLFEVDLRKEYQSLQQDVLHLINNKDAVIKQYTEQLIGLNPNVKIVCFKHAGHAGFLANNAAYRDAIGSFIDDRS